MTKLYKEHKRQYENTIKGIQKALRQDFKDNWMMTSTRVNYRKVGIDAVIHNYRSRDEQVIKGDISGSEDWVTPASGFEDPIERLLGTRDLALLENVLQWAGGKKPFLWRCTEEIDAQRALVLGIVDYEGFDINAVDYIDYIRLARGVSIQKIGTL